MSFEIKTHFKTGVKIKISASRIGVQNPPRVSESSGQHTSALRVCVSGIIPLALSVRTGLEAIMETYAFWRPPVRTLTFEDFTNMQKQQGV